MKTLGAPLVLALAAAAAGSDLTVRTIVLTGMPPPGLPTLTFAYVSDPRLVVTGQVAFYADLAGPGITAANNGSVWSDRTGTVALGLREGDLTSLSPTTVYSAVPYPAFTDSGRLGVAAATMDTSLPPTQPIRLGVFSEFSPPPGFAPLARDGDPVPNLPPPGMTFAGIGVAPMTDSGVRAFVSNKNGVLWVGDETVLSAFAMSGTPAPGAPSGMRYGALFEPAKAAGIGMAFGGTLLDEVGTRPVGQAIWARPLSQTLLLARTGGAAAGVSGALWNELSAHPEIVAASPGNYATAFWGRLEGGKVTAADDTAIWVFASSPFTDPPRLREGEPAPGTDPGVFFDDLPRTFSLADENWTPSPGITLLAFRGSLRGSGVSDANNSGIWLARSASLSMLAREGDQAPRLPAGTVFASFSDPVVTERGQVVFLARVRGGGTTGASSVVLYATEFARQVATAPAGRAVPVVRTGDAFPVSAGETRIVHEISFDSQPRGTGLSATDSSGSFLFKLTFKDPIVPPPPPPTYPFRFTEGLFEGTVRCLADLNADGILNLADFGTFQTAYALGDLRTGDSNGDGSLTLSDFGAFQASFALGCP